MKHNEKLITIVPKESRKLFAIHEETSALMKTKYYIVEDRIFDDYKAAKAFSVFQGLQNSLLGGISSKPTVKDAIVGGSFDNVMKKVNDTLKGLQWSDEAKAKFLAKFDELN